MAKSNPQMTVSMIAEANIADFTVVQLSGTTKVGQVITQAANTTPTFGVVERGAAAGMPVNVVIGGSAKVRCNGATLTAIGVPCMSGDGTILPSTNTAGTAPKNIIGINLEVGATGKVIEILLTPGGSGYIVPA